MFEDRDLTDILLPVMGVFVIIALIRWRVGRNSPPATKTLYSLASNLMMIGVMTFVMITSMPSTYRLERYGYPEQFNSLQEVHKYLREQNRVLVRIREVVYWFLVIFTCMFLQTIYSFAKTIASLKNNPVGEQGEKARVKIFDFDSRPADH
jgi:L-asparagine transporter-like permease